MNASPLIRIKIPNQARGALAVLMGRVQVGQAIAQGMDVVNEDAVRGIRQRISGPGVRRFRKGARMQERRTGLRLVSFKQGANIGVDTGTLRRSIGRSQAVVVATADAVRVTSTVGSNQSFAGTGGPLTWGTTPIATSVRYAAVHEYGGGNNIPARPYVGPEVEMRTEDYSQAVGSRIERLWNERRRQ